MKFSARFLEFIIVTAVLLIDQITKLIIQQTMLPSQSIEVIKGFFNITFVLNKGAAFGIFSTLSASIRKPFFAIISIIALALIIYLIATSDEKNKFQRASFGMILAGALGNFIDRIFLGEVRDFLDFYWNSYHWPAFNIADTAICIGTGILIVNIFFAKGPIENETNNENTAS